MSAWTEEKRWQKEARIDMETVERKRKRVEMKRGIVGMAKMMGRSGSQRMGGRILECGGRGPRSLIAIRKIRIT